MLQVETQHNSKSNTTVILTNVTSSALFDDNLLFVIYDMFVAASETVSAMCLHSFFT